MTQENFREEEHKSLHNEGKKTPSRDHPEMNTRGKEKTLKALRNKQTGHIQKPWNKNGTIATTFCTSIKCK